MRSPSTIIIVASLLFIANAEVFEFPLPNGFPNVSDSVLKELGHQAGGPIPSSSGPTLNLPSTAYPALQAVAFNEIFEVAFFSQLLQNITEGKPGFDLGSESDQAIAALNASQAQEQLHFIQANEGLQASKQYAAVKPCHYQFPVNNINEALAMADEFTALLMGAIQALITDFGDAPKIVTLFDAVLGQEGQQDGYFRWLRSQIPNQAPYLTATQLSFLYNHIVQHYVVPGSCPQKLNLPKFNNLLALEAPPPRNTTITFSTTQPGVKSEYHIAYMSGQQPPYVVPITGISAKGKVTKFTAAFPFDVGFSRGVTVAALVKNPGPFSDIKEVSNATLAGPALLNVYYA